MATSSLSQRPSVGTSVPRIDGAAKVTGHAIYVDDMPAAPGEIFGATVRSPVPRGRLKGVSFDPAFDWSDVTIVRAADVPVNVVALILDDQPVLADTEIRHAYEPILLLGCADKQKLARARDALKLDIEPLPAVLDLHEALAKKAVLYGEDNVQKRYLITKGRADVKDAPDPRTASEAAIDEVLARCEVVVSGRYSTQHQEQLYIEPQGIL
ncbi:MAG TPA: xanthine dehydrogenase, partial [Polyangiaceae bacterium]|nr:xanthine dehydrogenase [Polyangiaceae bacterium]